MLIHPFNPFHGIGMGNLFALNQKVIVNIRRKKRNFLNKIYLSSGGAYSITSEYGLVIKSVEIDDNGEYFCRAQNSEGFGYDSKRFFVETKGLF